MLNYNNYKNLLNTLTDTELKLYLLVYFYNIENETKYYPVLASNIKYLANVLSTTKSDIHTAISNLVNNKYLVRKEDKLGIKIANNLI